MKIQKLIYVLKRPIYALTFDKSIMIRSLYYESNLFNNQRQSNEIINILSLYTEIPRYHLRFMAGSRGHIYHRHLQYKTQHDVSTSKLDMVCMSDSSQLSNAWTRFKKLSRFDMISR